MREQKWNTIRRVADVVCYVVIAIIGIVLIYCNCNKIIPGFETWFDQFITTMVAYGSLIGFGLIGLGTTGLCEVLGLFED